MKLLSKEKIGSNTLKRHDPPKTPYQRIMESSRTLPNVKEDLSKQLEKLNPFVLRETIEKRLFGFHLPAAGREFGMGI
jgi:hypothetical protein